MIIGLVSVPLLAYAKSYSVLKRTPEYKVLGNSQNIQILEAYSNTNPTNIGGPTILVVDETALSAYSDETGPFVDPGSSGTGAISVYVVREGDTLGEIATMFGVSGNTIRWANDLKSNTLKVGQELVILPISGVKHVVKSGDTLKSLATKYKADLEEILSYNNISADSKIAVGDVIIIPDGVLVSTAGSVASTAKQNVVSGFFIRPIKGGVKSQGIHGHNGVDLAAPVGTTIVASADGKVIVSRTGGYNGGYGTYVVISHSNGTQSLYAHMNRNDVSVGQTVEQGQVLGTIGMTGKTTGPHIHFEIRGARNPF